MTQLDPPAQKSVPVPALPQLGQKLNPRLLIPLSLLVAGCGLAWYFWLRPMSQSDAELELSGRIEGYETDVGAKIAGRVETVTVREGDRVRQGQTIAQLDDEEIQAQLRGATARVTNAKQQELQARLQINVLESQITEAQLNLRQSQGDAQGRITQAEATVAGAEAQLNEAQAQLSQARAELELARKDRDRFAQLARQGAATRQRFDQAQTNLATALATVRNREAAVNAARKQVNAAQGALVQAQTTDLNPDIRNAQVEALNQQLAQARSQFKAAQAEVANAQAARQEIAARVSDLNVISPIEGVVQTRSVEPGEVVANGQTLLTLLNPQTVYLRGYIPEGDIGKVRVGQKARIFLDSAPEQALDAEVAAIDPEASFTPENIYFREDRVNQVFGVKLSLENPAGFAKPGMPADGEILVEPEAKQ